MELEDNGIGDVIEDEDQLSWSFFSWDNYIIGGFNLVIWGEMAKLIHKEFPKWFGISYRTMQAWKSGNSQVLD